MLHLFEQLSWYTPLLAMAVVLWGIAMHKNLRSLFMLPVWMLLLFCLSPSLQSWSPIGHEAQYATVYQTGQMLDGNTIQYPSMQLWWWLWGQLFQGWYHGMLLVSLSGAGLSLILFSRILSVRLNSERWGMFGALLLLFNHTFLAWSLSVHNIIPPLLFGLGSQAFLMLSTKQPRYLYPAVACFLLCVFMRMEYLFFGFFLLIQLKGRSLREIWPPLLLGALFLMFGLAGLMQDVPGDGERVASFYINWNIFDYFSLYWELVFFIACLTVSFRNSRKESLLGMFFIVLGHLFMSSFNDYSTRHMLPFFILFLYLILNTKSLLLSGGLFVVQLPGLYHLHQHFYEDEDTFFEHLESYPNIPRISMQAAKSDGCAWIAESEPFAGTPVRSHFNVYSRQEFEGYKEEYGCVDWCFGLDDWRWTSLGVRDRATRVKHLYYMEAKAVVEHEGASCLQYRLARRK